MITQEIIPVLLGADLNCYSMARAFHERYGVRSYAFGRYTLGTVTHSRILRYRAVPDADTQEVLLPLLKTFAKEHKGALLILVGCTDAYADLIIENREFLSKFYFCSAPSADLAKKLISKDAFYLMCEEHGLDYPKTVVLEAEADKQKLASLPFSYPIVLKPASSIRYWQNPFDGMKKVYILKTEEEAKKVAETIFRSGYDKALIVQDFIPGDDAGMYVLTAYSDKKAKVKMMCLGHVLLEEHTPKGVGNHVAILTEYHQELMEKVKIFLETVGYTGFSNFDIKFDPRDGKFKIFEINLRQGRSNYYVTHSGANLAEFLVMDATDTLPEGTHFVKSGAFWHTVPKKIIYSYIKDKETMETVKALIKKGHAGTALFYRPDLHFNPMRLGYVTVHNLRYHKKYKQYP